MRVAAITGDSGSGKTTLLCQLMRHYIGRGMRVAAIKHTHHALNEERRGDTAAFAEAGADPVILAAGGAAIVFARGAEPCRIEYRDPRDLLQYLPVDLTFIEGWKNYDGWPALHASLQREEAIAFVDRISPS